MNTSAILKWFYALVSAFVGGAATSFTNMMVAPESFNFNDAAGVKKVITSALVAGAVAVGLYLKQSPLPYYTFEGGSVTPPNGTGDGNNPPPAGGGVGKLPLILGALGTAGIFLSGCTTTSSSQQSQVVIRSALSIAAFEVGQKLTDAQKVEYKAFLQKVADAAGALEGEGNVTPEKLVGVLTVFTGDFLKGPNGARYKFYLQQVGLIWQGVAPHAGDGSPGQFDAYLRQLAIAAENTANLL